MDDLHHPQDATPARRARLGAQRPPEVEHEIEDCPIDQDWTCTTSLACRNIETEKYRGDL